MVVCTLCSCYPWPLLGIPPGWYKSDAYRARAVREPRKVLAEFGVTLPDETAVRVWDSTAEVRYLVLPMRPEGTEGWSEEPCRRWSPAIQHDRHWPPASEAARMSRMHDMGGRFGDGPVQSRTEDAPVFAQDWHARALAVTLACGALGQSGTLMCRAMPASGCRPRITCRFSYYEKWIAALADLLVERGVLTAGGSEGQGHARQASIRSLARHLPAKAEAWRGAGQGRPADRDSTGRLRRFSPAQAVRTRHPSWQ